MFIKFRSIITVGILLLCNNTAGLSADRINPDHQNDKKTSTKSVSVEQFCTTAESAETSPCSIKSALGAPEADRSETTEKATMASRSLVHVDFEVFGKVQGVFFRKNTVDQGRKLKLKGWCMNTPNGTVKGVMEGDAESITEMKHWLANVGSKMSRIEKAEFKNEKPITNFTFPDFSVRH